MFNGSRFFNLARKWREENKDPLYFRILQDVMNHYFGSIIGYQSNVLIIKGAQFITDISFVLDAVGYYNYSIEGTNLAGDTIVILIKL